MKDKRSVLFLRRLFSCGSLSGVGMRIIINKKYNKLWEMFGEEATSKYERERE